MEIDACPPMCDLGNALLKSGPLVMENGNRRHFLLIFAGNEFGVVTNTSCRGSAWLILRHHSLSMFPLFIITFFVYGLSDPEIAQDLIRSVLPATAVQHLNLATLTRQGETFVDPELRDSYADLLFECQLARPLPSGLPEADSQRANI